MVKHKSYNPFKMWGSYVLGILGGMIGWFISEINCSNWATNNPCTSITPIVTGTIISVIIGFLIGYGIHAGIRAVRN